MKTIAKKSGGKMEFPSKGSDEWKADIKTKPEARTNAKKIDKEAEARKAGGKVAKKVGGPIAKNVGGVAGSAPKASAARAPRQSGGRTGCDSNPFSSARAGTAPKGHKVKDVD